MVSQCSKNVLEMNIVVLGVLLSMSISSWSSVSAASREKRFLIVPPTSPTRHQWIGGIGVPLDLENIAVTTGYVFKAQYFLPTKAEHLRPEYTWDGFPARTLRERRELRDNETLIVDNATGTKAYRYETPVTVIEEKENEKVANELANDFWDDSEIDEDTQAAQQYWSSLHESEEADQKGSRWDAYKMLEGITNSRGLGGKDCVLRTICESAATPISHQSGIIGEMLHILLTPSTSNDQTSSDEDHKYKTAEDFGKSGGPCDEEYPECEKSLMDIFTSLENPFESLFNTYL